MNADLGSHAHVAAADLNRLSLSATAHCLTGCAIGEVSGMTIGSALGWSDFAMIVLAVALAFFFGYSLTALPLVRARLAFGAVVMAAFASDTISITIMEAIDNAFILLIPGAIDAGLDHPLFWGSLAGGLAVAFPFAFAANRYLIGRGRGHAKVHQYHLAAGNRPGHEQAGR